MQITQGHTAGLTQSQCCTHAGDKGGAEPARRALLQLEALAKAAEEDLERDRAEGADIPAIRAFEDFKKKMRRRGDSDKKRAEKLARRHARCALVHLQRQYQCCSIACICSLAAGLLALSVFPEHCVLTSPTLSCLRPLQSKGGAARS